MHWAQVKDAYDRGFFHLPRQHKNQQNTSLQEEFNITRDTHRGTHRENISFSGKYLFGRRFEI